MATLTSNFTVTSSRPITFIGHSVACDCETAVEDTVMATNWNYEAIMRDITAIKSKFVMRLIMVRRKNTRHII